jgi:predicted dehydrogenase/threonine dehydrogenase-like Zn-dependent dehydrogenase
MRQILLNDRGALIARMPRPVLEDGTLLVRVRYSLVSTGTELSGLRASADPADKGTVTERARASAGLARHYLRAAIAEPDRAMRRVAAIARGRIAALRPPPAAAAPKFTAADLTWTRHAATTLDASATGLRLVTDASSGAYQAAAGPIAVDPGTIPVIAISGAVEAGAVTMGVLNEAGDRWLGSRVFEKGAFDDQLIFDPAGSAAVTFVVAAAGAGPSTLTIDRIAVSMLPALSDGLPQSELEHQGWNVGYSAAGEVLAVGGGVTDLVPGDLVACAGAGVANHADYVVVPRNLACRVPAGCPLEVAATTTVGAIALQGVRRAAPQLGERIAVIGLGLIGQITVQLLRASGARVYGLDLDNGRVERARTHGLSAGASDPDAFRRLIRDATGGKGADRTVITAATKASHVINLAMDVTRAKGTVVIVGDVGLHVERAVFYRKEIDLLMSTSYGPGRYDAQYEQRGADYPFAYVRWTLNRNMQAYMESAADGRIDVKSLVDKIVGVDQAPDAYRQLAAGGDAPLAVLLRYPDDARPLPEAPDATAVHLRGHRRAASGQVRYALVGAGAFGMSMLVPQMAKRRDVFFLRAIVSRTTVQASNFARANQVEILATDLDEVLRDPEIDLAVIATRHNRHAAQVAAALRAGKHVFVEKPLALSWDELDDVVDAYQRPEPPLLMVGFNRRFSPAIEALMAALPAQRGPLVMNYRVNGGYIPPDHWVQTAEGGGRNLGEACHMYDTLRFLAASPVRSLAASAIQPGERPLMRTDNFAATIGYQDGSLGTLVYTAAGPKTGLGKERLEVFCDGDAYVVDDFQRVTRASDSRVLWEGTADKGHEREMSRLADALSQGGPPPIPVDELFETSAVALHVEDLLSGRGTAGVE